MSDEEPFFPQDINTPEGSVSGRYEWDDDELDLIGKHRQYAYEYITFLNDLENEGPDGKVLPKIPKPGIKSLLENKRKTDGLFGVKLHEYLIKNLVNTDESHECPTVDQVSCTNLEQIKPFLVSGFKLLKANTRRALSSSIHYGAWLEEAYQLHYLEKESSKRHDSWQDYIKKNIGIQDSYARKLRDVHKIVKNYPRFLKLGLSFSEVYRRKNKIDNMLKLDKNIAQYWKQV